MTSRDDEIFAVATRNRLLAVDMFAGLTDEQWSTPSLCAGWTVREVCAHLIPPETRHLRRRLVREIIRFRGDLDTMVDVTTREVAARPTADLVRELRDRADEKVKVPVLGPFGPMTDTAIHLRDAARPLGLDACPPPEDWRDVLDFIVTKPAERGFVGVGRTSGLRLEATDLDWSHGSGDLVRGTAEALALGITGRAVVYDELDGPGVEALRSRD